MANTLTNANLSFKYGTEQNLTTLRKEKTKIVPGTFYITSDTNRMYLGVSTASNENDIVNLNQGVTTVEKLGDLPTQTGTIAGQFYYVTDLNVLCVYNGNRWVQINPDTKVTDNYTQISRDETNNTIVNIANILTINDDNSTKLSSDWDLTTDKSFALVITETLRTGTGGTSGIPAKYDYKLEIVNKQEIITTNESGKATIKFIANRDGDKEVISTLDITGQKVISGTTTDYIPVSSDTNGKIFINGKPLHDEDIQNVALSINDNGEFITELYRKDDANSRVAFKTDDNEKPLNRFLPEIAYGKYDTRTETRSQSAKFTVQDLNDPTHRTANLDVYTTGEVDAMFKDKLTNLDAVKYIGTITDEWLTGYTSGTIFHPAASKVENFKKNIGVGYAFKVGVKRKLSTEGIYYSTEPTNWSEDQWADVGDLLIANLVSGTTENADGYIPVGSLRWDYIPAGDDRTYYGERTTTGIDIHEQTAGDNNSLGVVASIDFAGDHLINVAGLSDESAQPSTKQSISITHKTAWTGNTDNADAPVGTPNDELLQTEAQLLNNEANIGLNNAFKSTNKFSIIQSLDVTKEGHIADYTTQEITLIDTNAVLQEVSFNATAPASTDSTYQKQVTLTSSVELEHIDANGTKDQKSDDLILKSNNTNLNIEVENNGATVAFNLVWGTF